MIVGRLELLSLGALLVKIGWLKAAILILLYHIRVVSGDSLLLLEGCVRGPCSLWRCVCELLLCLHLLRCWHEDGRAGLVASKAGGPCNLRRLDWHSLLLHSIVRVEYLGEYFVDDGVLLLCHGQLPVDGVEELPLQQIQLLERHTTLFRYVLILVVHVVVELRSQQNDAEDHSI